MTLKKFAVLAGLALGLVAPARAAGWMIYTDPVAFGMAAPGLITHDFVPLLPVDDGPAPVLGEQLDYQGVTFFNSNQVLAGDMIIRGPSGRDPLVYLIVPFTSVIDEFGQQDSFATLVITPAAPVRAFGFTVYSRDLADFAFSFSARRGQSHETIIPGGIRTTFFGFVADTDVTSFRIFKENGSLNLLSFSAPAQAPPAAIPEPSLWLMLVWGFGLVGAVARRRHLPRRSA